MLLSTQPVTATTDCRSPTSEMEIRSDDCLGPSSESSSISRDDNSAQDYALHAIGRRLGNGFTSHVRRWKRENTRKKLESHLIMRQQARRTVETTRHETMSKSPSFQSLGDIGMTLFSPLNVPLTSLALDERRMDCKDEFVMALVQNDESTAVQLDTDTSVTVEDESDEDDFYHLDFIYNDGTEIEAPLLLNMDDMRQLRQAMPSSTQLKLWKRLYSLARDGDVFQTFLSSVAGHRQTLLVIHTSTGETFGGFAEAHWGKLALKTDGSYHGTGRSFLFSIDSSFADLHSQSPSTVVLADEDSSHVTIHPWQGVNEYSILCSTRDGGRLCMGGGGKDASFGFCIEDHFTKGTSGPCATFGNKESLSSSFHFDIVDFEVYGFVHNW